METILIAAFIIVPIVVLILWLLQGLVFDLLNRIIRRNQGQSCHTEEEDLHRSVTVSRKFVSSDGKPHANGAVFTRGEYWSAKCSKALAADLAVGDEVEVTFDGMIAEVRGKIDRTTQR